MSSRPTGTLSDDRLLELRETTETMASELGIEVTPVAADLEAAAGDRIDWEVDEYDGEPMLVFTRSSDEQSGDAPSPRRLREEERRNGDGNAIVAPVPDTLVRAEPPSGLGIELEAYDDDRPLLFDAMAVGETIGLVPVRYDDGSPYRQASRPGVADDSDPVAKGVVDHEREGDPTPRPETVDAPIDPLVLDDAMADAPTNVPIADVIEILEAIETHDLASVGDHVAGQPPLSVDERAVCLLEAGTWNERLAPDLEAVGVDVGADALAVAADVHDRQARALIDAADADAYAALEGEYERFVTDERDTAEWEAPESGVER